MRLGDFGFIMLVGTAVFALGMMAGVLITPSPPPDECRAQIEQSYEAFQKQEPLLTEELLVNALTTECVKGVEK